MAGRHSAGQPTRNGDPGHWIVDGNYGGTLDIRLARADTAIILDLPRLVCTTRALRRSIVNRGRSIQAEGCPERLDLDFLRWVWRYPTDSRPRLDAALRAHGGHLEVVKLTSAREVRQFLHQVGPAQRADADRGESGHE